MAQPKKDQCAHGHPFLEFNTYMYRGKQRCRRCISLALIYRRKLKAYKRKLIKKLGERLGAEVYEETKHRVTRNWV